jgi:DDE superfamily endonuclease
MPVTLLQVISLPNLRIIDFSYGHMGSTHDSTAWEDTQIVQEHEDIIKDGEWIWADSAYPVRTCLCFYVPDSPIPTFCLKISAWVVAPYKKPECNLPDNEVFNNHVSQVRIQLEHAIGYLKGQFQSLKELRVKITNQKSHKFVTWIACCIGLHVAAVQCSGMTMASLQRSLDCVRAIPRGHVLCFLICVQRSCALPAHLCPQITCSALCVCVPCLLSCVLESLIVLSCIYRLQVGGLIPQSLFPHLQVSSYFPLYESSPYSPTCSPLGALSLKGPFRRVF